MTNLTEYHWKVYRDVARAIPKEIRKSLTPEQTDLIFEPLESPETFYQDGELTLEQASRWWVERLKEHRLDSKELITAILG